MNNILEILLEQEILFLLVVTMGVFITSFIKIIMKKKNKDINLQKYEYLLSGISFVLTFIGVALIMYFYQNKVDLWEVAKTSGIYGALSPAIYLVVQAMRKGGKWFWIKVILTLLALAKKAHENKLTHEDVTNAITGLQPEAKLLQNEAKLMKYYEAIAKEKGVPVQKIKNMIEYIKK
jgi:hypothetical protein